MLLPATTRAPECARSELLGVELMGNGQKACRDERPFQVQMRCICLSCGGDSDDEFCAGPFLFIAHVEFDPEEFRDNPLDLGFIELAPAALAKAPWVEDEECNELRDHPVLRALRGERVGPGLFEPSQTDGNDCVNCGRRKFDHEGEVSDICP